MRYYYEQDNLTNCYYIIDRYSDTHVCDCFCIKQVEFVVHALNEFEERRVARNG